MKAFPVEINQSRLRGGQRVPKVRVEEAVRSVQRDLKKKEKVVSVAFVSEKEMKRLNAQYRGKHAVTDILSFSLDDPETLGELILNYEQAERQAKEMGHSTRDEIIFLLVHGMLHLYGYDHETPKDSKKMFPLQTKILTSLGIDPRL